ncbi:hypothetical protein A3Q56_05443 [Intoshia linei]|uniref:39S ribosomal protein L20, mitochondrial n=1 Tax=Intoshia linei TaxID=1819745 RepID=A0A177AZD2_9BILA|nr:hypothetical protein A3Q56_05443 [Intoshia linei]
MSKQQEKFWRIQQILRFSWRFKGRKRNCFAIGRRYANKALYYSSVSRILKRSHNCRLYTYRFNAACSEHGLMGNDVMNSLNSVNIILSKKILTHLSIYEPKSFKSLMEISRKYIKQNDINTKNPLDMKSFQLSYATV